MRRSGVGRGRIAALALVWLVGACGGGGSGGTGDLVAPDVVERDAVPDGAPADVVAVEDAAATDDAAPDLTTQADVATVLAAVFEPEPEEAREGRFRLTAREGVVEDELVVDLVAGPFLAVVGWAFDLTYDPSVLELRDVALTDALSSTGGEGVCVTKSRGPGRVNIGCARFAMSVDPWDRPLYGGALAEDVPFATAHFTVLAPGRTALAFDPARRVVRGGDLDTLDASWRGGIVTITRRPDGGTR